MWGENEMAELKPCPFCGRQRVDLVVDSYHGWPNYERTYKIICMSCSAQLYGENAEELIDAWNRRAGEDG